MRLNGWDRALLRLYGLAWRLARLILRRSKRLADGWTMRLAPADWAAPADLWVQAASGGEAYLATELLEQLPPVPQGRRVLLTTWTRQGLDVLETLRDRHTGPGLHIQTTFFPLDEPALMARALRQAAPRVVVLLETELWPGLLAACAEAGVPVVILNGRMTDKSLAGYRRLNLPAPGFWTRCAPAAVGALSERDAARFGQLFGLSAGPRLRVIPNIKFDRARVDAAAPDPALSALLPAATASPILLLASVREEEEPLLLPVAQDLHAALPAARLLIAPRHLPRAAAWLHALKTAGLAPRLRSQLTSAAPAAPGQLIIWDTFGELGALYALADRVFVGGSLAPLGGQNMLEPLARGRVPLLGPHTENFAWAVAGPDGLAARGLAVECADATALTRALLAPAAAPERVRADFGVWLAARQGGTRAGLALLEPYLQ